MTPEELPAMFDALEAHIGSGCAGPAVTAMGRTYQRAVKYTLSLRTNAPDAFTVGGRGLPPAMRSGNLRRSVLKGPTVSSGVTASTEVAPHTIYAGVQETGLPRPIVAHRSYMHFTNAGGSWYLKAVRVGPHPYMAPTTARTIANGSLTAAAMRAFEIAAWGA
jgi:hypothetical protein